MAFPVNGRSMFWERHNIRFLKTPGWGGVGWICFLGRCLSPGSVEKRIQNHSHVIRLEKLLLMLSLRHIFSLTRYQQIEKLLAWSSTRIYPNLKGCFLINLTMNIHGYPWVSMDIQQEYSQECSQEYSQECSQEYSQEYSQEI